jgi:streptogramin lyase
MAMPMGRGPSPLPSCAQFADGQGEAARFSSIKSVAVDATGVVYASDQSGIRRVGPDGTVTTLAPTPSLHTVTSLAVGPQGFLYAIEYAQQRIVKIAPDGAVTVLAGAPYQNNEGHSNGWIDGVGPAARFSSPLGLCVDAQGVVYVADAFNHRIRRIAPDGTVTTIAGSGPVGGQAGGFADGPALSARFGFPRKIVVDAAGTLYLVDAGNQRIRAISPSGTVSTLTTFTSYDGLGGGIDLVLEPDGNLLFIEANTVRRVTPKGEVSTAFEGPETPDPSPQWQLIGLALLPDQRVLVVDPDDRLFQRPLGEGAWSVLAGAMRCPSWLD